MKCSPDSRRAPRGQSVVLTALIMLILVIAVFFTFTVGERVRQKTTAQAAADAVAYSTAVVEARAMNFFALSNRAMVSHTVAATSLMAHQSYLTFYEDALIATALSYRNVAQRLKTRCDARDQVCSCGNAATCQAATRAFDVADLYAYGMPTLRGRVFNANPNLGTNTGGSVFVESGGVAVRRHVSNQSPIDPGAREGWACRDEEECHITPQGPRGAMWFHDQYHGKRNGNWCDLLNDAVRDEYSAIQVLRAHQLDVHAEVLALLGDTGVKGIDVTDVNAMLPSSGDRHDDDSSPRFVNARAPVFQRPLAHVSLAQQLARTFDRRLEPRRASLNQTRANWNNALVDPERPDLHRDYDQVLYVTRYPDWVVHRNNNSVVDDGNWRRLRRLANQLAGQDSVETIVRNAGNAGAIGQNFIPDGDPGRSDAAPWSGAPWTSNPAYLSPLPSSSGGKTIAQLLHSTEIQTLTSLGAEDHGAVTARYVLSSCGCAQSAQEPLEAGRSSLFNTGGNVTGLHLFHGYTMNIRGHTVGVARTRPLLDFGHMGHMRFRGRVGEPLLGAPRVVTELRRTTRATPRPWDLKISAFAVQGEVNTQAPEADNREVAASAGALVYFHHPEDGPGPGSKEPPNLWSPFWRAKLHPLRPEDLDSPAINPLRQRTPLREMLP